MLNKLLYRQFFGWLSLRAYSSANEPLSSIVPAFLGQNHISSSDRRMSAEEHSTSSWEMRISSITWSRMSNSPRRSLRSACRAGDACCGAEASKTCHHPCSAEAGISIQSGFLELLSHISSIHRLQSPDGRRITINCAREITASKYDACHVVFAKFRRLVQLAATLRLRFTML